LQKKEQPWIRTTPTSLESRPGGGVGSVINSRRKPRRVILKGLLVDKTGVGERDRGRRGIIHKEYKEKLSRYKYGKGASRGDRRGDYLSDKRGKVVFGIKKMQGTKRR